MDSKNAKLSTMILLGLIVLAFMALDIYAAIPSGASVEYVTNSTKPATLAGNRTDEKGSITVIKLSTVQQNDRWKAYVGNVSGKLTLDDGDQYTIYDWTLTSTVFGTVFATRNQSVSWATINCSNLSHMRAEEDYLSMGYGSSDNIENTFLASNHTSFYVGDMHITNCNNTALYVNSTKVEANDTAPYQEVALYDHVGAFVYASRINDSHLGYRRDLQQYDFEMIVGEKAVVAPAVRYFFFVELQ